MNVLAFPIASIVQDLTKCSPETRMLIALACAEDVPLSRNAEMAMLRLREASQMLSKGQSE